MQYETALEQLVYVTAMNELKHGNVYDHDRRDNESKIVSILCEKYEVIKDNYYKDFRKEIEGSVFDAVHDWLDTI